jgi:hypothetical protein
LGGDFIVRHPISTGGRIAKAEVKAAREYSESLRDMPMGSLGNGKPISINQPQ